MKFEIQAYLEDLPRSMGPGSSKLNSQKILELDRLIFRPNPAWAAKVRNDCYLTIHL
jgi:hypothetical protein